jgi:hypothetical protein
LFFFLRLICGWEEQREIVDKPISLIRISFPQINCEAGHTAAYAPNLVSFLALRRWIKQESRGYGFSDMCVLDIPTFRRTCIYNLKDEGSRSLRNAGLTKLHGITCHKSYHRYTR